MPAYPTPLCTTARMRFLHTSDWHLGNRLMEHSRHEEFEAFLNWLLGVMQSRRVDVLLVSGDIFDNTTPSDSTQALYCDFLSKADTTGCRHIILTAGNHDGCTQLEKARPLLTRHHVSLSTRLSREEPQACRIPIPDDSGAECATVYAVPFLRIPDVALPVAADAAREERDTAYIRGIAQFYAALAQDACKTRQKHCGPIIAMGHLAVQGATLTGSTRSCIGTLDTVGASVFGDAFDYVALGHIHRPCSPATGTDRIRYSGSPLPMGMDEAGYPHEVLLIDIDGQDVRITPIPVPRFVNFESCTCSTPDELHALPAQLKARALEHAQQDGLEEARPIWLHLSYSGTDMSLHALNSFLEAIAAETGIDHFRARLTEHHPTSPAGESSSLTQLTPEDIFLRRLAEVDGNPPRSEEERRHLSKLFSHVLSELSALSSPQS